MDDWPAGSRRPSAVAATSLGILPSAAAMVAVGDFDARVLGVSMVTVAGLMVRFVAGQFDQLVLEAQLQQEVYHLANTDALTGLLNRRALVAAIEQRLPRIADSFAIALLDLDGFEEVNDRLGHPAGDELLRVVGRRLAASCGPAATVGRLGGDEFLVLFEGVRGAADVQTRVTELLGALCQPTQLGPQSVMVQASLGFSIFPGEGLTAAVLLATADQALYADKRQRTGAPGAVSAAGTADRRRHRTS